MRARWNRRGVRRTVSLCGSEMDSELLRIKSPYITLVKICLPVAAKIHTPATSLPVPSGGSEG